MGHPLIWALAFVAAARLTRFTTDDVLMEPVRNAWHRYWSQKTATAQAVSSDAYQELMAAEEQTPPDPRRVKAARARKRRTFVRFERARVVQHFLSCPWCVGFWIFAAVTGVAWLASGAPAVVFTAPWWFALPALALGGNWIYALAAAWVDRTDD